MEKRKKHVLALIFAFYIQARFSGILYIIIIIPNFYTHLSVFSIFLVMFYSATQLMVAAQISQLSRQTMR